MAVAEIAMEMAVVMEAVTTKVEEVEGMEEVAVVTAAVEEDMVEVEDQVRKLSILLKCFGVFYYVKGMQSFYNQSS